MDALEAVIGLPNGAVTPTTPPILVAQIMGGFYERNMLTRPLVDAVRADTTHPATVVTLIMGTKGFGYQQSYCESPRTASWDAHAQLPAAFGNSSKQNLSAASSWTWLLATPSLKETVYGSGTLRE